MIGAVMFFLLIGLMFIGVPIAFSMGLSAIIMLLIRSSASVVVVNVYLFHFMGHSSFYRSNPIFYLIIKPVEIQLDFIWQEYIPSFLQCCGQFRRHRLLPALPPGQIP